MAQSNTSSDEHVNPDIFCRDLSAELGEPLFGTAVNAEFWFLLEYNGPWRARATTDNELPSAVQQWLDAQLEVVEGNGRVQFLKQPERRDADHVSFFAAHAHEQTPRLYHFALSAYEDLLALDLSALYSGGDGLRDREHEEPLFLVCTNGLRDRCCALYGTETYQALSEVAGDAIWQTTHIGGHRFAANLITFPDGTYYGRLSPEDALAFVETRRRGDVDLAQLRGRVCYDKPVQAADYFLRRETGQHALTALRHVGTTTPSPDVFQVRFATGEGTTHTVELKRELADLPLYASCGAPKSEPTLHYRLLAHRVEAHEQ